MILPFIQEIDSVIAEEYKSPALLDAENSSIADNPVIESEILNYTYENSFESKYLHFKEKIEKDRLAWETLAGRK